MSRHIVHRTSTLNQLIVAIIAVTITCANVQGQSTVVIGRQEWMAQNLNVDRYWDGAPIQEAKTPAEWKSYNDRKIGCYCSYDNEGCYGSMYGKLYNWYAIKRGVAPHCWRVATKADFDKLVATIGTERLAKKLKSKHSWNNDWNGNDSSTFHALAAGCRNPTGTFSYVGRQAFWWTSTVRKTAANREGGVYFFISADDKCDFDVSEEFGFYVRCVRDVGVNPPLPCP